MTDTERDQLLALVESVQKDVNRLRDDVLKMEQDRDALLAVCIEAERLYSGGSLLAMPVQGEGLLNVGKWIGACRLAIAQTHSH